MIGNQFMKILEKNLTEASLYR